MATYKSKYKHLKDKPIDGGSSINDLGGTTLKSDVERPNTSTTIENNGSWILPFILGLILGALITLI